MNLHQKQVLKFMKAFGQVCPDRPTVIPKIVRKLRYNLIKEELKELNDSENLIETADAIADLLYVVYGTAVAYGIDIAPIFDVVHKSNMTKMWNNSPRVRKTKEGKIMKSPSYIPPTAGIRSCIEEQIYTIK